MAQRMEIMEELEDRKKKLMKGSPCPSCGLDNNCAIDSGKSSTLCWCMTEDVSNKPLTDVENCYCKGCLKKER